MTKQELEQCIEEYGKDIFSFCCYLTGSRQEAEDLYQDTFLKAVELKGKMDAAYNPKSYLLSIALRIWKNRKRKFARRRRIADVCDMAEGTDAWVGNALEAYRAAGQSPEEAVLAEERRQAVGKAVEKLPQRLRTVVLLFYMEELSTAQIAAVMGIPAGTVLSRLHQARKQLKKELEM